MVLHGCRAWNSILLAALGVFACAGLAVNAQTKFVAPVSTATISLTEKEAEERLSSVIPPVKIPPRHDRVPLDLPVPEGAKRMAVDGTGLLERLGYEPASEAPRLVQGFELLNGLPNPFAGTLASFGALSDNNTAIPPDVAGAVGPNHLVVTLNSQVRVQNRSGGTLQTLTLNGFWSSVAPAGGVIDPRVQYDAASQRWIATAVAAAQTATSGVLVAVSQTADPTGLWYQWRFPADATGLNWADYPTLGFDSQWVTISVNLFTVSNSSFVASQIYVLTKSSLYTNAVQTARVFSDISGTFVPATSYDAPSSTMYLAQHWNGNSGGTGFLRLSTISGTVGSETFTPGTFFVSTPNTWSSSPPTQNFEPQLGTFNKIAGGDSRLQNCLIRNGSLWCTQTAFIPAGAVTRSAAQWWQITPTSGTVVQFGRIDDPTGVNNYAFPSIAVSKFNDVLVGYSHFSATQFASARGSFRFPSDAAGTLPTAIAVQAGLAVYFKQFGGITNSWGDYTTSVVDPVNDRTLWTLQEFAALPSGGADRWDTWWLSYDSNAAPTNTSVSPAAGGGSSQVFTAVYTDANGNADLATMNVLVNSSLTSAGACYVSYNRTTNAMYLGNDAGTAFLGPLTPGGAGTLQNGQCQLSASGSSASGSGSNFSLGVSLTFQTSFVGTKNVYLYAIDGAGANGGFGLLGTWTNGSNSAPVNVSVTPNSGSGSSQVFTAVYSDPNGFSDLSSMNLLVNSSVNSAASCYVLYVRASNQLYLANDAGTAYLGPATLGAAGTLQNTQCQLNAGTSTASGSGTNFNLGLTLTFQAAFAGNKNVYLYATDFGNANSGFSLLGTWTTGTNASPVNISVTPSSGSGSSQVFTAVYSDTNGFGNLASMNLLVNSAVNSANGCYVLYQRASNMLYLANDAGSAFLGPVTLGAAGTLQNSQCQVNAATSTASGSVNNFTLALGLTFQSGFVGLKNVYLNATDAGNASSGFGLLGTWSPGANSAPVNVSVTPNSGTGSSRVFSAVYSDPNGFSDLATMGFLVNATVSSANSCYVVYSRISNALYLVNDAGNAYLGPLTPGGAGTIQNTQCQLVASGSSASGAANSFTLGVSLNFLGNFSGQKNLYLYAADSSNANSGFSALGTWSPAANQTPVNVSITPSSGSGASQVFTAAYSDGNGFTDLATMSILVNTAVNASNACYVVYYRASNTMYLIDNAGTALLGPLTPGGAGSVQNSQCVLTAATSTASGAGNNFSFQAALTFQASFTGTKNLYLYATDNNNANSGFSLLGTWTR